MSLFRKVRTLLGALAHKPFSPRLEKADLDPSPQRVEAGKPTGEHPGNTAA